MIADLVESDEYQIQVEEEIAVQSHIVAPIISNYEKGQSTQASFPTMTTSMSSQLPTTTKVASKTVSSEEVRSANNSDQSNSVIAAEIHVNIEVHRPKATYDPMPDGPYTGPGIRDLLPFNTIFDIK